MRERPLWLMLEDAFIIVSIVALWPNILGWQGWYWDVAQWVAVIGLVWIFVRRVRRYQARGDETKD